MHLPKPVNVELSNPTSSWRKHHKHRPSSAASVTQRPTSGVVGKTSYQERCYLAAGYRLAWAILVVGWRIAPLRDPGFPDGLNVALVDVAVIANKRPSLRHLPDGAVVETTVTNTTIASRADTQPRFRIKRIESVWQRQVTTHGVTLDEVFPSRPGRYGAPGSDSHTTPFPSPSRFATSP